MDQKKISQIAISVCVIAVLAIGYWTSINISALLKTRNEWINKTHELSKVKHDVAEIERLLSFYKKEKSEFQKYLFQEKDIPGFLDGLSGFAQSAGINIVDMKTNKFQEVRLPDAMKESQSELARKKLDANGNPTELSKDEMNQMLTLAAMPINIKIKGPYESIVNFYRHLENFKQLISIGNIDIATANNAYPALQCDFTLKIYSLKTLEELQNHRQ
ncbi:MAG: type 4a pilus biogenesis protein PilO [Candidatus Omnitrophica bacterium]|nr:type 4a pilus biogenesis protein PilO [Candidatus Omnitrophota bacterium]